MAFNLKYLYSLGGNAKKGLVPNVFTFYNQAGDDVTESGYFNWDVLSVGDQINVISADYATVTNYYVASISGGSATVGGGVQSLSGAGAVDIVSEITELTTTGADALTLADGKQGQEKTIIMIVDGGNGTLTPANFGNGTTITFADAGDSVTLVFTNSAWYVKSNEGAAVA